MERREATETAAELTSIGHAMAAFLVDNAETRAEFAKWLSEQSEQFGTEAAESGVSLDELLTEDLTTARDAFKAVNESARRELNGSIFVYIFGK